MPLGAEYRDGTLVTPRLQVLAMGFNWSLFFCQKTLEYIVKQAGLSEEAFVVDSTPPPTIEVRSPAVAVYVDGAAVLGASDEDVGDGIARIRRALAKAGLERSEDDGERQGFTCLRFDRGTRRKRRRGSRRFSTLPPAR